VSNTTSRTSKTTMYKARILRPDKVDDKTIAAWADLEARAVVPNAFMSPYFVLPSLRYLESPEDVFGMFVEKASGGVSTLVGVALFKVRKPTRRFPLKHLAAFESIHSYLSDFLIDRDHEADALKVVYSYVTDKKRPWHALYLNDFSPDRLLDGEAAALASDFGMEWTAFHRWQRAVFNLTGYDGNVLTYLSKNQRKNYQRNLRNLQKLGHVGWTMVRGTKSMDRAVDEFIRLEHMGWKGRDGTSLYSNMDHMRFFREIVGGFNEVGRVYFTELDLNGKCISSTSNLISGKAGFAFKMGWDVEYAKHGPGIVNEIKTLEYGKELLSGLEYIDSSAAPESYINDLWTGRRDIVNGMFSFTPAGNAALASLRLVRLVKASLLSR